MPALHWAMTSSGPETMNSGEPTTGSSSVLTSEAGNGIQFLPLQRGSRRWSGTRLMLDLLCARAESAHRRDLLAAL